MTPADLQDHIDAYPIPGVAHLCSGDHVTLTIGPLRAIVTVDDEGDGCAQIVGAFQIGGAGEWFSTPADLPAALRTVCGRHLRHTIGHDLFRVEALADALAVPGLYADVLRETLTTVRANLDALLSVTP